MVSNAKTSASRVRAKNKEDVVAYGSPLSNLQGKCKYSKCLECVNGKYKECTKVLPRYDTNARKHCFDEELYESCYDNDTPQRKKTRIKRVVKKGAKKRVTKKVVRRVPKKVPRTTRGRRIVRRKR